MIFNETTIVSGNWSINNVSSQWSNVLRDKLRRLISFGRTAFERDVCGRIQLGSAAFAVASFVADKSAKSFGFVRR